MAKDKDIRPIIKMKSTAGTGYTYVTKKNRRNDPDRITLKKYDPVVRKHVEFREAALCKSGVSLRRSATANVSKVTGSKAGAAAQS